VEGDVGTISQNRNLFDVAQQMMREMLCCTIDEFLCHYAPFRPTDKSVDDALAYLKDKQLIQDGEWQDLHGQDIPSKTRDIETVDFKKFESVI